MSSRGKTPKEGREISRLKIRSRLRRNRGSSKWRKLKRKDRGWNRKEGRLKGKDKKQPGKLLMIKRKILKSKGKNKKNN